MVAIVAWRGMVCKSRIIQIPPGKQHALTALSANSALCALSARNARSVCNTSVIQT